MSLVFTRPERASRPVGIKPGAAEVPAGSLAGPQPVCGQDFRQGFSASVLSYDEFTTNIFFGEKAF